MKYKILRDLSDEEIIKLAEDGWELVTVKHIPEIPYTGFLSDERDAEDVYYFKKV